jgi:CRP/FNR family transcriptional regulator, cyclic AMP receptor protein
MIPRDTTSPADRILASLDEESSKTENYSVSEIEALPIADIEHLPIEPVTVELNDAGLNYLAGLQSVRELVEATAECRKEDYAKPVNHNEKRKIFERHFLFGKLSAREIEALISYSRVQRCLAGRQIFAKGSPGQSLMAVLRGSVKISSLSESGREIVFTIFNAGEIFGEIAILDGDERSADATALTDCELLVLNRRDILPVLENRADLCTILLKVLCRKALVQLAESVGLHAISSSSVELHVSQRELGNMAAGSRGKRQQAAAGLASARIDRSRQALDHDPRGGGH